MSVPAICFERLEKNYGGVRALDAIDLEVPQGTVFGFLGPNGAGKTTAIRVLLDLIRPTGGRVSLLGFDAQRESVEARRRCGYLPGDLALYEHMTGMEFFDYVASFRGRRGAAQRADARYRAELVDRLGLDPTRPIGTLSKGNRQKIGVVQALMMRPEVIVLDEPTSGLDPLVQEEVGSILREVVVDGRTVFFSSHVLAEVEAIASSVAMLRSGQIVAVVDLAEERRLAPHRITVTFGEPLPAGGFGAIAGVRVVAVGERQATFESRDQIDPLIKVLARYPVQALETHEPSLEDLFLSYYDVAPAGAADRDDPSAVRGRA